MTAVSSTEVAGLARRLRESTRDAHHGAATGGITDRIVDGTLSLEDYAAMLGQLWHVYFVLELAAEELGDDPIAARFDDGALHRAPAIARDLVALCGPEHRPPTPLPETDRYLQRIAGAAVDDPVRFVAHHYTRYLGDLSGGQFMGRRIAQTLGLDEHTGVGWYQFDGIADADDYKSRYRDRLDGLDLDAGAEARLIDEVRLAYRLNVDLLAAIGRPGVLDPDAVDAIVRHLNADHADDGLAIVRHHGAVADASSALVSAVDDRGIDFVVSLADGRSTTCTVKWSTPIRERADVRRELVRMTELARATSGRS